MSDFVRRVPEGEDRERLVCQNCDYIAYENPKVVVGSVIHDGDTVLLCRRAIEPRKGFWTIPAGYMETGETVVEGAEREAWEEARARINIEGVLAVYSIAKLSQVQIIFRATWACLGFEAGAESIEVRQFTWNEIPWREIAFPSVRWALQSWYEGRNKPLQAALLNPAEDHRGTLPLP
jgi:ADP-ribose pyrophosphatase YjhB (NUDIX family)